MQNKRSRHQSAGKFFNSSAKVNMPTRQRNVSEQRFNTSQMQQNGREITEDKNQNSPHKLQYNPGSVYTMAKQFQPFGSFSSISGSIEVILSELENFDEEGSCNKTRESRDVNLQDEMNSIISNQQQINKLKQNQKHHLKQQLLQMYQQSHPGFIFTPGNQDDDSIVEFDSRKFNFVQKYTKVKPQKKQSKRAPSPGNRSIIRSAITSCLKANLTILQQQQILKIIEKYNSYHIVVLLQDSSTIRGLYEDTNRQTLRKLWGQDVPDTIEPEIITEYWRYDALKEEFKILANKILTFATDAVSI